MPDPIPEPVSRRSSLAPVAASSSPSTGPSIIGVHRGGVTVPNEEKEAKRAIGDAWIPTPPSNSVMVTNNAAVAAGATPEQMANVQSWLQTWSSGLQSCKSSLSSSIIASFMLFCDPTQL
jgi:hypothetical protein